MTNKKTLSNRQCTSSFHAASYHFKDPVALCRRLSAVFSLNFIKYFIFSHVYIFMHES